MTHRAEPAAPGVPAAPGFFSGAADAAADLLVPRDRVRHAGRVRMTAVILVISVLLFPAAHEIGTGTEGRRHLMAAAFAVAAWMAHRARRGSDGPWPSVAAAAAAGAVVFWASHGSTWGFVYAAIVGTSTAIREGRSKRPHPRVPPLPARRGIPGVLVWIAEPLIAVLIVKTFALQAMHVPTGSMEPTLMGAHGPVAGDRLIANQFTYLFGGPSRWEIAIFEFPLLRETYFVKRIVGLPGETVEIRDGDVWIDGRIAGKPDVVQAGLWVELFPQPARSARRKDVASSWRASEDDGWKRAGEGLRVEPRGNAVTLASFSPRLSQTDLRVSFAADVEPGALVAAEIVSRGRTTTLTVPAEGCETAGALAVEGGGSAPVTARVLGGSQVELAVADGKATARVDGVVVARLDVPVEPASGQAVRIGAGGARVTFSGLRVEHDVVYTDKGPGKWTVPPGCYFALGDNSRGSDDSRSWSVTELVVRGREVPYRAAATVPDAEGRQISNLSRDGDIYRFKDLDGVLRQVRVEQVAERRDRVPYPFVPRDHLVGRAALVFYPFPPFSPLFRPRFLP